MNFNYCSLLAIQQQSQLGGCSEPLCNSWSGMPGYSQGELSGAQLKWANLYPRVQGALLPASVGTQEWRASLGLMSLHLDHYMLSSIFVSLFYTWGNWGTHWLCNLHPQTCKRPNRSMFDSKPAYLAGERHLPCTIYQRGHLKILEWRLRKLPHTDVLRGSLSWGRCSVHFISEAVPF